MSTPTAAEGDQEPCPTPLEAGEARCLLWVQPALVQRLKNWRATRIELSARENSGNSPRANEWAASDDEAADLVEGLASAVLDQ